VTNGRKSETTTWGRHLLAEFRGCDSKLLDDIEHVEQTLERAAVAAGATVVQCTLHRFAPQGVSGVVVIEESHLSVHTWPEYGYAAVDFFTCGDCTPERACTLIAEALDARETEVIEIERGRSVVGPSMRVRHHVVGATNAAETATHVETNGESPPTLSTGARRIPKPLN